MTQSFIRLWPFDFFISSVRMIAPPSPIVIVYRSMAAHFTCGSIA